MARSVQVGLRLAPEIKTALDRAAKDDRRPVSSLVELVLEDWLTEKGYLPTGMTAPDPSSPRGYRKVS